MTAIMPIAHIGAALAAPGALAPAMTPISSTGSFGDIMMTGLRSIDAKVGKADALIQAFAQGDTIPVHQVTLALEEARLAVEIAMQVRTRLTETYRDFLNMQV